jgi:hypothetical protein
MSNFQSNPGSLNPDSTAVQSYLNILQSIITRMAGNSGNCKTWCITLTSALLVLIADKGKVNIIWIALIPVLLFGFLDAYYLGQERAFRETYNDFVKRMHGGTASAEDLFKVAPQRGFNVATYTLNSLTSFAVYPFYLSLLTMLAIVYYFLAK